ncbi:MAG: toxin-antitoxin system YwqK family antitoxin [Kiritimatiellae bacterium]|nr:toxin-antitoxin system YwqK family antitoxin [Kiritimatiellia bacterium]
MNRMRLLLLHALLLAATADRNAGRADEVHMKDGTVHKPVTNVRELDSVLLFEKGGETLSIDKSKVDKAVSAGGALLFKSEKLTGRKVKLGSGESEYVFYRNGAELARAAWDEDGVFMVRQGRVPDGIYTLYYDSGKLQAEFPFKHGQLNGLCRTYFETGKLEKEASFLSGKEEGVSKSYYKSGELQGEATFLNGQREGTTKLYYPSGALKGTMTFVAGQANGITKMYYESGQLEIEVDFREGRKHGPMRKYFESGQLRLEGAYKDGVLDGPVKTYNEFGKLKNVQVFEQGKILRGE